MSTDPRTRGVVKQAFAHVLKDAREAQGWVQIAFSEAIGISATHLSLLERARRGPSLAVVFAVAKGLRMKPEELVMQTRVAVSRLQTAVKAVPDNAAGRAPRKPILSLRVHARRPDAADPD